MGAYMMREALELRRDYLRLTLALFGSVILLLITGYGINLDVDNLSFAVLDRDQTTVSENYILNIAGSRYFVQHPPITSNAELDRRMATGEISLALEIPPNFGRDIEHGRDVKIGAWVDGAMPVRAEIIQGYVQFMHLQWLTEEVSKLFGKRTLAGQTQIEIRYRYNPGFESLIAMVPAVIPLLLLVIPANLAALSVVREKELGSIVNFYVTPVTRFEFLFGKQIPYVVLAMVNFLLLAAVGIFVFRVPFTGDVPDLRTRRLTLRDRSDRHRPAHLGLHAQPGGGHFRHYGRDNDPCRALLGTDRPGCVDNRRRPPDRTSVPDVVLHHDRAWRLFEGARLRRSAERLDSSGDHGSGAARSVRPAAEKAGQLRCASPTSCSLGSRNCAAWAAITSCCS